MRDPLNPRLFAILAAVVLMAAGSAANAASFDCTKARTPNEHAICASPVLSELDVEMATLYGVRMGIPMLPGGHDAARDAQRAWLAQRSTCGDDFACLVQSYQIRIAELKQIIADTMQDYCVRVGIC